MAVFDSGFTSFATSDLPIVILSFYSYYVKPVLFLGSRA